MLLTGTFYFVHYLKTNKQTQFLNIVELCFCQAAYSIYFQRWQYILLKLKNYLQFLNVSKKALGDFTESSGIQLAD